jgi:hypothetical protein
MTSKSVSSAGRFRRDSLHDAGVDQSTLKRMYEFSRGKWRKYKPENYVNRGGFWGDVFAHPGWDKASDAKRNNKRAAIELHTYNLAGVEFIYVRPVNDLRFLVWVG